MSAGPPQSLRCEPCGLRFAAAGWYWDQAKSSRDDYFPDGPPCLKEFMGGLHSLARQAIQLFFRDWLDPPVDDEGSDRFENLSLPFGLAGVNDPAEHHLRMQRDRFGDERAYIERGTGIDERKVPERPQQACDPAEVFSRVEVTP